MEKTFRFRVFYYINNVAFSFFLLSVIFFTYAIIRVIFQKSVEPGIVINGFTSLTIPVFQAYFSTILCTIGLYQSFLVLHSIKTDTFEIIYWVKKYKLCAMLFFVAASTMLITTSTDANNLLLPFYATGEGNIIGISTGGINLLAAGYFFAFVANIQPQK